jgi:hypothetical protein
MIDTPNGSLLFPFDVLVGPRRFLSTQILEALFIQGPCSKPPFDKGCPVLLLACQPSNGTTMQHLKYRLLSFFFLHSTPPTH